MHLGPGASSSWALRLAVTQEITVSAPSRSSPDAHRFSSIRISSTTCAAQHGRKQYVLKTGNTLKQHLMRNQHEGTSWPLRMIASTFTESGSGELVKEGNNNCASTFALGPPEAVQRCSIDVARRVDKDVRQPIRCTAFELLRCFCRAEEKRVALAFLIRRSRFLDARCWRDNSSPSHAPLVLIE